MNYYQFIILAVCCMAEKSVEDGISGRGESAYGIGYMIGHERERKVINSRKVVCHYIASHLSLIAFAFGMDPVSK